MTVYFIGAGPGAADLITVRGARTLATCGVCPPGCRGGSSPRSRRRRRRA
ncbi:SAM-dependent methyltransferase, partial [Streptomyces sp. NPDC000963]